MNCKINIWGNTLGQWNELGFFKLKSLSTKEIINGVKGDLQKKRKYLQTM